jgi:glycosyltransferase involved in cell wall biosynthesis
MSAFRDPEAKEQLFWRWPLPDLLFSVVIACYNQENFVRESVESALSQRHLSKEVIVIDDASKDGTADVLRSFGDSITFVTLPINRGATAARNHGASLAKGRYLVFLDGDDVLMPWALDVYSRLATARDPMLILGRAALFHGEVPAVKETDVPRSLQFVDYANFFKKDRPWVYNSSSLVVERAAFCSAGGWSEGIFYQDAQDLLNKMGFKGTAILLLNPETVWYRMHSANAILNIAGFMKGIKLLLAKAKAGAYPGDRKQQIRRSAWFGGLIFYWLKESIRTGAYWDACRLFASTWWMILLAIISRGIARVSGRKATEELLLHVNEPVTNSKMYSDGDVFRGAI